MVHGAWPIPPYGRRGPLRLRSTLHLPLDREYASFPLRHAPRRYERDAMITSNNGFTDWGEIFGDPCLPPPSSAGFSPWSG